MQNKVKEFNENRSCHNKPMPIHARILDIQSELGELSKEYLKCTKYGTSDFNITEDLILEYGDILYSLLSLSNELNINSEDALNKVLEKYQKRIEKNNNMGSSN